MSRKRKTRRKMRARTRRAPKASGLPEKPALLSLKDHLRELQGRLFSTVAVFILAAAVAYPFFDHIANWLLAPLNDEQELVYLTPGGAFSFIIKVCAYVGLIATLPIIIYHIYRFVMPAVQTVRLRRVLGYTVASLVLALCGILFAYYVSLPAALYFLTGFDLHHINPMLTIDSYFSFIMTYMLAGAVLFQVPLLMLIVNSVTPLTPKKLMSAQKFIIVGSFIVAAVISPTPDALNQTLLASPVIIMYQFGIVMIWRINARAKKRARQAADESIDVATPEDIVEASVASVPPAVVAPVANTYAERRRTMDIMVRPRSVVAPPSRPMSEVMPRIRQLDMSTPSGAAPQMFRPSTRSVDGIIRS